MLVCWNDRFARDVVAEKHRQGLWGNPIAEVSILDIYEKLEVEALLCALAC